MADSVEKVEDFIYSIYAENYDSHKAEIKSPLDGESYIVDGAKLHSLNVIVDFELDKCYIEKSRINTAGNGLFAKNDILQGELITFYPSDIASYAPNGDLDKPGHVSIETYSERFKIQFEKNTLFGITFNLAKKKTHFGIISILAKRCSCWDMVWVCDMEVYVEE